MSPDRETASRRKPWREGPTAEGWLALTDDDLLYRIESLPASHPHDRELLEIVRSDRHFFVRQEAAKKVNDAQLLKAHSGDRHIGQILVRAMTRHEDIDYLERLLSESRHLEVRKAAEAQLQILRERLESNR